LNDVMNVHMDLLVTIVNDLSRKTDPPRELFSQLSRELLHRYTGAADSQKVLLYELNNLPQPERRAIVEKQRLIIDFAEALLKNAAPKGKYDHGRLTAHVMLFFGMLNWTHNWFKPDGAVSRDEIADLAAETTWVALS